MKFIFLLIFVGVSYVAGYLLEPSLRMQLTGKSVDFERPDVDMEKKPSDSAEDKIPFELNPVLPATPPPVVPVTPPPVVPTNPETLPTDPPITPATPTNPEVTPSQPETPVSNPDVPVQNADPVMVMKESSASRQISKFSAAQVLDWQAGSVSETIDGVTYQIGNVTYQAETPFGTKNLSAKALIKDGKVVRWISPKSGMQIE
ncbi:MAG: hypothetical protein ACK46A_05825 [Akkermansiaceae bacterium]